LRRGYSLTAVGAFKAGRALKDRGGTRSQRPEL